MTEQEQHIQALQDISLFKCGYRGYRMWVVEERHHAALAAAIEALKREQERTEDPCPHCGSSAKRITCICLECGWKEERELPPLTEEEVVGIIPRFERGELTPTAEKKPPPSPDLDLVRQLIQQVNCNFTYEAGVLVQKAIPALKSLLAEAEYLHGDAMRLHLKELNEDLATAQVETIARTREREHWHQRTLEAEQKLQAMTESRNHWKECYESSTRI